MLGFFFNRVIILPMVVFPKDFFWGAATSAHQVEGNNLNSDWWDWEKSREVKEPSGEACRHYQLYKEDFDLARQLNHNCHRLSIEWSRIQPEENKFSSLELNHYKEVILALRARGLEPMITLHHFTNPLWFARLGGWKNRKAADYFLRYVEKVVEPLAEMVTYWITINEPMVYTYQSFITGVWPPQDKSLFKAKKAIDNLAAAHIKAYGLIHSIYKKSRLPSPSVSIAHNMIAFVSCKASMRNKLAVYLRKKLFNFRLIEKLAGAKSLDFIGLNYYTRHLIDTQSWSLRSLLFDNCPNNHDILSKNSLGWEIYPQGLYDLLLALKKYGLCVFILENGICDLGDNQKWEFIKAHLEKIHAAIEKGVRVRSYIYWSLLDNFEWADGFTPRFGLIGVDYHTYKRTVRESAKKFSEVCKTGKLY